jgi:hypothetical protein
MNRLCSSSLVRPRSRISCCNTDTGSCNWCGLTVCCQTRQQVRVRLRVQTCLRQAGFVSVRRCHDPTDLQPVSLSRSASQLVGPDFYPKVVGSSPTRPTRFAGVLPLRSPRARTGVRTRTCTHRP